MADHPAQPKAETQASHFDELDGITHDRLQVSPALPLCLWDAAFIGRLDARGQLMHSCQLLRHDGLIFDTHGYVLPCNAMPGVRLGRMHEDFHDRASFLAFWHSPRIEDAFARLRRIPDSRCHSCTQLSACGGGCAANWQAYSFNDIRPYVKVGC